MLMLDFDSSSRSFIDGCVVCICFTVVRQVSAPPRGYFVHSWVAIVHLSMGLVHEHDTTIKAEYGLFRGKQVKKYGANQGQNFPSKIGMQLCTVRPFKSKIWKFYDNLIRARSSSLDSHLSVLPIFYFDNTSLPYYHILCCENLLLVIHKCVGILYSNK